VTDLFSSEGRAALARLLARPSLLGFDFDGTLAPIRTRPEDVALAPRVAAAFAALTRRVPVALITGRAVADVLPRLAGTPRWVVGNHGAEGLPGADRSQLARQAATCAAWREQLDAMVPLEGVWVEDKAYTLCLHYRQAPDRDAARVLLETRLQTLAPAPHLVPGKCAFNLLPEGANDKFTAMQTLARAAGAEGVFFIGDDATDEAVFARAPQAWVTVKVGSEGDSDARFRLREQGAVQKALDLLLDLSASFGRV